MQSHTDYLHCAELYQKKYPRYDCVIVTTATSFFFAKLILVFTCKTGDAGDYPIAMIQPMDAPIGRQTAKDKALRLIRLHAKPQSQPEFIHVQSIRRGAVLVDQGDKYRVLCSGYLGW